MENQLVPKWDTEHWVYWEFALCITTLHSGNKCLPNPVSLFIIREHKITFPVLEMGDFKALAAEDK